MGRIKGQKNKQKIILWDQDRIIRSVENEYLTNKRNLIYIACEDFNFIWDEHHLTSVIDKWNQGVSVFKMADELNRDVDELAVLLIDLSKKGAITSRQGGLDGSL